MDWLGPAQSTIHSGRFMSEDFYQLKFRHIFELFRAVAAGTIEINHRRY
jgi:hypothetical protein